MFNLKYTIMDCIIMIHVIHNDTWRLENLDQCVKMFHSVKPNTSQI